MHDYNYMAFKIYIDLLTWDIERILWIAYYKNGNNKSCLFDYLAKDVLKFIFTFLQIADDDLFVSI